MYAVGEIFLVVVGILIAISIDDWNHQRLLAQEELESYEDIISDLRKDSIRLESRIRLAKLHADCYYELNSIAQEEVEVDQEKFYDFIVMTITFDPITKSNHQTTIQELNDHEIREALNTYFTNEYRVKESCDEFNKLITEVSRPFVLEDVKAFSIEDVFIEEKYQFPPSLGRTSLDHQKIEAMVKRPKFTPINAELRMALGWFLAEIEDLYAENASLIGKLEGKLAE